MLSLYQQSSRRTLVNLTAAMVGVIIIVAGVLVFLNKREMATRYASLGEQVKITQDMVRVSRNTSPTGPTMSPAEIVRKFGPATVYMEVSWKLIHTKSDRQVYHRYDGEYPLYIQIGHRVYPWLSTDSDNRGDWPVGGNHQGSGFVVSNNGYILTNRHMAAAWHTKHDAFPRIPSKLFQVKNQKTLGQPNLEVQYKPKEPPIRDPERLAELVKEANNWVPFNDDLLVEKRQGKYYVGLNSRFEGRFDKLEVTFPENKLRIPARLVRISDQHDVALIKIDVPDSLPIVEVKEDSSDSHPGDVIAVLGYPQVSPPVAVRTKSLDPFNRPSKIWAVPELTVTGGLIGRLIRGEAVPKGGAAYDYYSEFGDVIQLTVNATGKGSSGGPVIDDRGRVIGIFSFMNKGDVLISFAIPIQHGLDIMGIKPVLD
jgi:S1-C subfamily serine protease